MLKNKTSFIFDKFKQLLMTCSFAAALLISGQTAQAQSDQDPDLVPSSEMPYEMEESIRQAKSQYEVSVFKRTDSKGQAKFVALISMVGFEDVGPLRNFLSNQIPLLTREELLERELQAELQAEVPVEKVKKKGRLVFFSTLFSSVTSKIKEGYSLFADSPFYHLGAQTLLIDIIREKLVGSKKLYELSHSRFVKYFFKDSEKFFNGAATTLKVLEVLWFLKSLYGYLGDYLYPFAGDKNWYRAAFYFHGDAGTNPKQFKKVMSGLDQMLLQPDGNDRYGIYMFPSLYKEMTHNLRSNPDYQEVALPGF